MTFCRYQDIFGKPGEGMHAYRFGGVALVDLLATLIIAYVITLITKIPYTLTLVTLLLLGFILHWLFCVPTSVMEYLNIKFQ